MKIRYELLLSKEQDQQLQRLADEMGFTKKSDFIRYKVFIEPSLAKMLSEIHVTVTKNA